MKNCNRRTFLHVFLAGAAAALLLPRKVVGRVVNGPDARSAKDRANAVDTSAAAALIKGAPHTVQHAARAHRSSTGSI